MLPKTALGVNFRHRSDVRRTTALAPKAEVHPRSCYVAKVPGADIAREGHALGPPRCGLIVGLYSTHVREGSSRAITAHPLERQRRRRCNRGHRCGWT